MRTWIRVSNGNRRSLHVAAQQCVLERYVRPIERPNVVISAPVSGHKQVRGVIGEKVIGAMRESGPKFCADFVGSWQGI